MFKVSVSSMWCRNLFCWVKERMKKKFDTKSKEDIPKSFFITKIHEMKQLREDLRKAGLVNDTKEFDKFCDFKNVDKMQSIVKQKLLEHKTRLDILRKLKRDSNADDSKTKND
jgi:cell division protein YceG involved in septum cleavage